MPEPKSSEELEGLLHNARARVRRLAAAVEPEEGTLVHTALTEAEEHAAAEQGPARPGGAKGPRPTEQRLKAQITHAEDLLKKEHAKFKTLLDDGNVRLALAVEQGVDDYYTDVRTVRRGKQPTTSASTTLRRLHEERSRLSEACRSLAEERDALAAETLIVQKSKQEIVDALRRRDQARVARYGVAAYPY